MVKTMMQMDGHKHHKSGRLSNPRSMRYDPYGSKTFAAVGVRARCGVHAMRCGGGAVSLSLRRGSGSGNGNSVKQRTTQSRNTELEWWMVGLFGATLNRIVE